MFYFVIRISELLSLKSIKNYEFNGSQFIRSIKVKISEKSENVIF